MSIERGKIYIFQYSIEILCYISTYGNMEWVLAFNILLKSSWVYVIEYKKNGKTIFQYSIEILASLIANFTDVLIEPFNILLKSSDAFVYLPLYKFFSIRVWASLERLSASNVCDSCLFLRFVLGIEFLFQRYFSSSKPYLFQWCFMLCKMGSVHGTVHATRLLKHSITQGNA